MKKEHIIRAVLEIIENKARELNLEVTNNGVGHAFDNSFWKDIAVDDSNIPNVEAKNYEYSIKLRSFWGCPEVDIRIDNGNEKSNTLLVLNYSDFEWVNKKNDKYIHSGDFVVNEVRCDSYGDYKNCINMIYSLIEEIENKVREYEVNELHKG